jgi:dTDP-4-amino-4,6-dideoxygalactose transaminase
MQIPFVDLHAQYVSIKNDIDSAIAKVIEETAFISGKYAAEFEKSFSAYCGNKHVIACANGTDSLEILMQAMGIGKGDEVIVPAISWISTSEAVSAIGAKPVFVDVDEYFLINAQLIEEKINANTKAIIPVHLYGQPADMEAIMSIAVKHRLKVIEDCAQSHGSKINGQLAGTFGDAASFSFYPGKNLGAYGDAGAMCTNDDALAEKARMIANHGQRKKHEHVMEGRNSRLDGLQGAILSVKLPHLEKWTEMRIANAAYYKSILNTELIELPEVKEHFRHVFHLFVIQSADRDGLLKHLENSGIGVAIHYPCPLPFLDCYKERAYTSEDFPMAYHLSKTILSIPMYPELSKAQMDAVADAIHGYFQK